MPILLCLAATVIDGDSIRCRNLGEVRLLGIDTADYRSSRPCRGNYGDHVCNDNQARAAKVSLRTALVRGTVRVMPVSRDRYGRMIAVVTVGTTNLSCFQIRRGVARYIGRYDNGGMIAKDCGL
jgi:endonuclease YncB( thermonuclease family)